jgi:hypothetical protein
MINKNNAFKQDNFCNNGGYLTYTYRDKNHFIGRFKYGGLGHFKKFLMKNFEVQEYLDRLEAGETPGKVLETKGYVSKNLSDMAIRYGFPATQEGVKQALEVQVARYYSMNRKTA